MIDKHFLWVVLTAGNVEPSAGGGGDPQVAGAGVEDDGELLGGGADLNLAIVLGLNIFQQNQLLAE